MKKSVFTLSLLAVSAVFITSCELTDPLGDRTTQEDIEAAQPTVEENVASQLSAIKVFENVNNYGISEEGIPGKSAFITGDAPATSWSGNTLTLDYANVPNYSGTITVAFNGIPMYGQGLSATLTYNSFVDHGVGISGSMVLAITQYTKGVSATFTLKTNGNLTFTEGNSSYLWSCDETVIWSNGIANFAEGDDDEFTFGGIVRQTEDTIITKLELVDILYAENCEYIKDGILKLTIDEGSEDEFKISCDFGVGATASDNGKCDNWVELSTDDITLTIELK